MKFSCMYTNEYIQKKEMESLVPQVKMAHRLLHTGAGRGNEFIGWLDLPEKYDKEEFKKIQETAEKIKKNSSVFIVIGIGGSYLGSRAAIEMLSNSFYNLMPEEKRQTPQIFFAGHTISGTYLAELLELVRDRDFSVNVISKSGTTTEPAVVFRFFKELLEEKYGKEGARERIYVTTDQSRGILYNLAAEEGYTRFVIPDDIGGRYSVLTPVGLLPMAVAGIDIAAMMQGARAAMEAYSTEDVLENDCYTYAMIRNILYGKGKTTEVFASYEPGLHYFAEWWKQLFGESEGKCGKGIFPATVDFSTDLHSIGQYLQDGVRNIFETVLHVKNSRADLPIPCTKDGKDGLTYLEGETLNHMNNQAFLGALIAHHDGGVPCLVVEMEKMDAYNFGYAVYFFKKACAISGYLLGVNPFDQPGVEAYKTNMFALLGKAGYEEAGNVLEKRLKGFDL